MGRQLWRKAAQRLRGSFRRLDKTLALLTAAAVLFGCLIQYSEYRAGFVTRRALLTQVVTAGAGFILMLLMSELDYRRLAAGWKFHLPVTLGLTLLTFTNLPVVYRPEGSDDSAWLRLGPFSVQPGEFFKFSFILTLAWHLDRVSDRLDHPREVLLLCLHGAAGCILIFLQGDMGSALIFFFIFAAMVFASGISWKYIAAGAGAIAVAAPAVWFSGAAARLYQKPVPGAGGPRERGAGGCLSAAFGQADPRFRPGVREGAFFRLFPVCLRD